MSNAVRIQIRRDTAAAWTAANPTLASGEPALETDSRKQKTGDGVTAWNGLAYDVGSSAVGLPTGGDPGSILMKTTNANYDSNWAATLDGGTFN